MGRWSPMFTVFVVGLARAFEIEFAYPKNEISEKCAAEERDPMDGDAWQSRRPAGPIVECHLMADAFIQCDEPQPLYGVGQTGQQPPNDTYRHEGKCLRMGGYRAEDIEFTMVRCRVLGCIECHGKRTFRKLAPCIIYTGHYFLTTLLYSIFLGVVAVDRFCLGYSAMAVGKLMTLGGFGIWWIVDIFLLVLGVLGPADDSNWEPNY